MLMPEGIYLHTLTPRAVPEATYLDAPGYLEIDVS